MMRIIKYLEQSPVFAVSSAAEAMVGRVNRELKSERIHLLQGLILTSLFFEQNSGVKPSDLAATLRTSRSNMSHMLSDLESKGWVKRVISGQDARQFHISLKPEGKKKATSLIKYFNKLQDQFEKELGTVGVKRTVQQIDRVRASYS